MIDRRSMVWTGLCCLWLSVAVSADTLVLRDGRRVQGELIAVRNGTVEFDAQRGFFGGSERMRLERGDVARIELDDYGRPDSSASSQSGGGRPSGLREREVNVEARSGWTDTGVTVRPGQTIYFNATGRVRWGPNRQDGPAGERGSPRNDNRPIPSRPGAALIGRTGEGDDYFFIGDDAGPIRVREGGRLHLGVNDDYLQDNTGSFHVTIYY